jgi:transposase-like protein
MVPPSNCPRCGAADVRLLTPDDIRIAVYRCHDCGKVFNVSDTGTPPEPTDTTLDAPERAK